jgi:hypothetical protein
MRRRRASAPFVWSRALRESDLRSTTKLVAFVQATYMDADGFSYPSTASIAKGASLNERSVERHRALLERSGWLIGEGNRRGGKSRTVKYLAAVPETANKVRRFEFEKAKRATRKGESHTANGGRRSPEEEEHVTRGGAVSGAAPLEACELCKDVRPLVGPTFHFCESCAGAVRGVAE